jgi:hypothetical protein
MATIQKRKDRWRALVRLRGITASKTFSTKTMARTWARRTEAMILDGEYHKAPDKTFGTLLERYAQTVSINKRTRDREVKRIATIKRDPLARVPLYAIGPPDISEWRDRRLAGVSAATVLRDWNLLNHACNIAVNDWHWLKSNPMTGVNKPKRPAPRSALFTDEDVERLLIA